VSSQVTVKTRASTTGFHGYRLVYTSIQFQRSAVAQQHILVFNKTLLSLGSCKLKTEEAYTNILDRACVPQIESLIKRDTAWDDLQLQAKLRVCLKEDWKPFRETLQALQQNLSYFKRKLGISEDFMVRG
jgi:hypothetical protein